MIEVLEYVPLTPREAASGVLGSISLACWIFLLIPQVIENYRNGSAEALSLAFLGVWFVGDVANLVGAVWAGLVPVIIAIGVYYCIADGILISQCVYYNIKNARENARKNRRSVDSQHEDDEAPDPLTPLLSRDTSENATRRRRASYRSHSHHQAEDSFTKMLEGAEPKRTWIKNTLSILAICAVGTAGWAIAWQSGVWKPTPDEDPEAPGEDIAVGAQVVGYFSAVAYLGARIPQIIKNYREKSCEGLSLLFFLLSLLGNLTYGAGIVIHSTARTYMITNIPWLIGSLGTMVEDIVIFTQFRIYAVKEEGSSPAVV